MAYNAMTLLAISLAVTFVAVTVAKLDGPAGAFGRWRTFVFERTRKTRAVWLADLFDCPFCLCPWLSAGAVAVWQVGTPSGLVLQWGATTGAAMLFCAAWMAFAAVARYCNAQSDLFDQSGLDLD